MIKLRPMTRNDLGDSYCCMNDPQTARLINRTPGMTYADHIKWFEQAMSNSCRLLFCIEDETGQYVGNCGFNHIDKRKKHAELWIVIDKYSRGFGYGSKATQALLKYGFYDLGYTLIYLHVLSYNSVAIELYRNFGFKKTAITYEDRGTKCLPDKSLRMELKRTQYEKMFLEKPLKIKSGLHVTTN